ncbi:translation initiation factor IF-2 subunit beta [Haloarchaeobius sp. TZWWS8]|uniref:translation initiation factor IF-2 subunit beta n=1 Tax=Haloarchaeobius sp. TZWWS8 TaxID=3446121 RepID=UPI003EBA6114
MDYDDQLDRAMDASSADQAEGDRFVVPDPSVRQEGSVTVYENFAETVDALNRAPAHLLRQLQTAFGTSAELDGAGGARFTGAFTDGRIEDELDEYVETFVRCGACGSPDTRLRPDGTTELKCDACGELTALPQS